MANYKYVVIGGGIAGGRACEGIRQVDENGSLVLITQEQHRPYERPPLSKEYLREEAGLDRVYLRAGDYYQHKGIEIIPGVKVLQINPRERTVLAERGLILEYQKLLLATGGEAVKLGIPGSELENVFTLRTLDDSQAIRDGAGAGKKALVMGGSFIGTEVAATLTQKGVKVIQIFPDSRLLERIVPEEVSEHIKTLFEENGVRILPGVVAERLQGEGAVQSAVLENGEELEIDLVVMGIGIRLNTEMAEEAGLEVREGDQAVVVDQYLRTSDPDIYAAGDIAAWPDATFDQQLRVEHWDVARRQGQQAGRNMAGEKEPYTALPYFFSDLFDLSFEVWGSLSSWDRTVARGSLDSGSFAIYYFFEDHLVGVLAVDRPSEEREPMQALVKKRPPYGEIAGTLLDEEADLAELAGTEPVKESRERGSEGVSFAEEIAPLFREFDVDEMKEISGFDLSNYEDARAWAERIYERLVDETMPCDEPWPEDKIQTFKRWMDEGKQP